MSAPQTDAGAMPTAPPEPPPDPRARAKSTPQRRRRRRGMWPPRWLRDWSTFRSQVRAWWYGRTADDLRAAVADTRRAPGWAGLTLVMVLWASTGFTWLPLAAGAVAWLVLMLATHPLWWGNRRRVRRFLRPLIPAGMAVMLAVQAWPWGWLLAAGLWLVLAGATDLPRARRRVAAWTLSTIARSARVDPDGLRVVDQAWQTDTAVPLMLEIDYAGANLPAEQPAVRDNVLQAARWALRHAGHYSVEWPAGMSVLRISATAPLPREILDRPDWGDTPGLLIGATDAETADGTVTATDTETGEIIEQHNIKMINPADEKHFLVVGGTGGGKSNFVRGFIARALREGWFPGGVHIFDGKAGSDYVVYEGRAGVHCVARMPEEWTENLEPVNQMMKTRYEEDAEFHRGNRPEPEFPRFLVVLDEVQEILAELGETAFMKHLRRWSKQIRAANGRLMIVTQRPDAKDAIPGAVKDMLEQIFVLGYVSPVGAREALGQDWRAAVDDYGAETVPGRGVARVGGKLLRLQTLFTDLPTKKPHLEVLYPPKRGEDVPIDAEAGQEGATILQWAPRPAPAPEPVEPEPEWPTEPPEATEGAQPAAAPQQDPHGFAQAAGAETPPAGRRRTV